MLWKILSFASVLSISKANEDTFPWMNNYVACTLRMPVYNYEPTILQEGTYSVVPDKLEFQEGEMIQMSIQSEDPSGTYKGLFITVLENGKSRGEWMDNDGFKKMSCDGSQNSALIEANKFDKEANGNKLTWKAPKCQPDMNYEIRATVVRTENEFQPSIKVPLKCQVGNVDELEGAKENAHMTSPESPPIRQSKDASDGSLKPIDKNYYYDMYPYGDEDDSNVIPTSSFQYMSAATSPPDNPETREETVVEYYYDAYWNGDDNQGNAPMPSAQTMPKLNIDDSVKHGVNPIPRSKYDNRTPEGSSTPEGTAMAIPLGAQEPDNNDWKPEPRPTPESGPISSNETPPMFVLFRGDWEEGQDIHKNDNGSPPEPENRPSTPAMNALFGGNPEPPATPENIPEPEAGAWPIDETDDNAKYVNTHPDPEQPPNPANTPEPEQDAWEDSEESDYEKQDRLHPDPERKKPIQKPPLGGRPEPPTNPEEISPESESRDILHKDTEKNLNIMKPNPEMPPPNMEPEGIVGGDGEKEDGHSSNPETMPFTASTNVLFRENPVPSVEFGGTPELDGNVWTEGEGHEDQERISSTPYMTMSELPTDPETDPEPESEVTVSPNYDKNDRSNPEPEKKAPMPEIPPQPETGDSRDKDGHNYENPGNAKPTAEMPPVDPEDSSHDPDVKSEPEGVAEESDLEKKPSTPPMNVLFGGQPAPPVSAENTPAPEGNADWGNVDNENYEHNKPDPELSRPNPESTPKAENSADGDDGPAYEIVKPDKPEVILGERKQETDKTQIDYYYDTNYYDDDTTTTQSASSTPPSSTPVQYRTTTEKSYEMEDPQPEITKQDNGDEKTSSHDSKAVPDDQAMSQRGYAKNKTESSTDIIDTMRPDPEGNVGLTIKTEPTAAPERRPKPLGMNAPGCENPEYQLPEGISTSFENGDYGLWMNDTSAKRKWFLGSGSTKSPSTGPDGAYEGNYYVYLEGSRPSRQGDQAILQGPLGIRGCFCIKFACHMHVDKKTTLELKINGETVNENRYSHPKWQRMTTTVDLAEEAQIEIVATRGMTFRSDVAIDDIRVTPGMCPEDM